MTSRLAWVRGAWALLLLAPLLAGAGCRPARGPQGAPAGSFALERTHRQALPQVLVTPSGRRIIPGSRDRHGVLLPLDWEAPGLEPPSVSPPPRGPRPSGLGAADIRLGPDDGHSQNEGAVAVLGDTVVAAWNGFTDTGLLTGVGRSGDGGLTWSHTVLAAAPGSLGDPSVKAGGPGRWYVGSLGPGASGNLDVYVWRSVDDGGTWLGPRAVTRDGDFDDKPYLDARGDEVLVSYTEFDATWPPDIRAARSLDGGLAFGLDAPISQASGGGNGSSPAIAPDGTYHVVWRDSYGESLWIASSPDRGQSWSADRVVAAQDPLPQTLAGGFRNANVPSLAVSPATGVLLVVWAAQPTGDPDVLAVRSTDAGLTWSAPARINDDGPGGEQFFPWVSFDEQGIAHAMWYDRRNHPLDIDVYYACSRDGGQTWSPNARVTQDSFPPVLPWEGGAARMIGDYNGIAGRSGEAFVLFQDGRRNEQDMWLARLDCPGGCARGLGAITGVLAVKDAASGEVALEWTGDGAALDGYGVRFVTRKVEVPACVGCGGTSRGVAGCLPTGAPGRNRCRHGGAVAGPPGETFFYNVRGACGGEESPR